MKDLTWMDERGNRQKTLPLRDLRIFLPSHGKNKISIESPLQSLHASPFSKEIGLPAIMPRCKARCYLLDLGLLKLLCRQDRVSFGGDIENYQKPYILYSSFRLMYCMIRQTAQTAEIL